MAYRFEIAPQAMADAEAAYNWIARDSSSRADRWYRGLFDRIATLPTYPRRCPLAPESEAFGEEVRQLLYRRRRSVYRILFTVHRGSYSRVGDPPQRPAAAPSRRARRRRAGGTMIAEADCSVPAANPMPRAGMIDCDVHPGPKHPDEIRAS